MSGALAQWAIIPAFLLFDIVGRMAHVLFEHGQWRTTHGEDAITATPEYGLAPVIPLQMVGKFLAQQATRDRFEIIHKGGWQHLGRQGQEPMDMIRFTVEFQHLALPFCRRVTAKGLQPVPHGAGHALAAIFRDQNQMIVPIINTLMPGVSEGLRGHGGRIE